MVKLDKQQKIAQSRSVSSMRTHLTDIMLTLEQAYMDQITESAFDEADLREHLYHRIRVLKDFDRVMGMIVADGQIAQADVIRMAKIETGELKEFF